MTVFKHEWLRTRSMLGTALGIAALLVVASALLSATGWPLLSQFGMITGIVALSATVPALQLLLSIDHYRTSFGRTGYFTQTLPLRGSRIYLAKLLWGLLVTLVGVVATLLFAAALWVGTAIVSGAPVNPVVALRDYWTQIADVTPAWVIIVGVATIVMFICSWLVMFYFAVAVGSEKRLNQLGVGGPVLVFAGLYVTVQLTMAASILLIPLAIGMEDGSLGLVSVNLLGDLMEGRNSDVMPLGLIPPVVVITALCLWRSARSWNRKVSLA